MSTTTPAPEGHDRTTGAYSRAPAPIVMGDAGRRIDWICAQVRGARVLDIGCGQGITGVQLARQGLQVTGVDRSAQAIAEAEAHLAAEPPEVRDRVRLVLGDAADLPSGPRYDTIILGELLEHVGEPARLIECAARHAAAGGRLIATVPFGVADRIGRHRTSYLSGPFELIAAAFDVERVEILGKWIGFVAKKPRETAKLGRRQPGAALLPVLEAGFEAVERGLLDDRERLKARLAELETRLRNQQRQLAAARDEAARAEDRLRAETVRAAQRARQDARRMQPLEIRAQMLAGQAAAVRRSFSFRLGHALVLGAKSPARLAYLPSAAWGGLKRLYEARFRHWTAQLAILAEVPPAAGPAEDAPPTHAGRLCYVLHNSLPYSSGGYAIRADGLARGLAATGAEVVCVTRPGFPLDDAGVDRAPGAVPDRDNLDGIEYRRILQPLRRGRARLKYMRAAADALTAEFERLRPQWVVAASNYFTGMPALIAARRLGIPFVYEVRGLWEVTRLSRQPDFAGSVVYQVQERLEAEVARRADHVFTLTGPMRDEMVRRGVPADAIDLLPNACDPERFAPRDRDAALAERLGVPAEVPVIGYVGTFAQYEGLDDLARACALLRARGLAFRLMLVGNENVSSRRPGPITAAIRRIAAANGLADWLILPGRVPHEEIAAYYSLIDIAPFPRKPQPVTEMVSPLKPLEALAMEKAVVVSSVAALLEIVEDGATGLVFAKGSVESLADTLQRLIADPGLRRRLGRAGREWVARERTWAEMGRRARARLDALRPAGDMGGEELRRIYQDGGTDGVIAALTEHPGGDAAAGGALVRAGKLLGEIAGADVNYLLARAAVRIHESEATLRALHWAAQRKGDLAAACEAVHRIERAYGPTLSPGQAAALEKLKGSPAYQLSILEDVRPAGRRAADSAAAHPGRLCYVLSSSRPYSSNGYAIRADGLARGLAATGVEMLCLTRPGFPLDIKPELAPDAVPAREIVDGIEYRRILQPLRKGRAGLDYMRASADELTVELEWLRPQWVVAASNYVNAMPALIAARRLGIPFVYEVRGFWEITRLSRQPDFAGTSSFRIQELLEIEVARRADHVFTLTGPMRDEMVRRGVPADAIDLLPNACDPERFAPRNRDAALAERLGVPAKVPVIGYVGTFVQYEGLDDLARACALLRARGLAFRLMLVGNENASSQKLDGPITAEIHRIAAANGLADWLIMPGRVPHKEIAAYYSLIDIAPFPRKPQPVTEMVSPLKPLEALAMEKAVVVSSVAALLEIVEDGATGLVFAKGSVESLADTLQRLIADPGLRRRLGRAGREWVARERTWAEMGRRARARLDALLDQPAAGPSAAPPEGGEAWDDAAWRAKAAVLEGGARNGEPT